MKRMSDFSTGLWSRLKRDSCLQFVNKKSLCSQNTINGISLNKTTSVTYGQPKKIKDGHPWGLERRRLASRVFSRGLRVAIILHKHCGVPYYTYESKIIIKYVQYTFISNLYFSILFQYSWVLQDSDSYKWYLSGINFKGIFRVRIDIPTHAYQIQNSVTNIFKYPRGSKQTPLPPE